MTDTGFATFFEKELEEMNARQAEQEKKREDNRKARTRLWEDEPVYVTVQLALDAVKVIHSAACDRIAAERKASHGDGRRARSEARETINGTPFYVDEAVLFKVIRDVADSSKHAHRDADCDGLEGVTKTDDDTLRGYLAKVNIVPENGRYKPYDAQEKLNRAEAWLSGPWSIAGGFAYEYRERDDIPHVRLPWAHDLIPSALSFAN